MLDFEDVISTIVTFLSGDDLNDIIEAINEEKDDDIEVPEIAKVWFGERFMDTILKVDAPVILVTPDDSTTRDSNPSVDLDDKHVTISAVSLSEKETEATHIGLRLERALRQLLREHPLLGLEKMETVKNVQIISSSFSRISREGTRIYFAIDIKLKILMIEA
jgi:hypothetical protein